MHCHSRQNSTTPQGAKGRNNPQYCCANNVACFSGVKTNAKTPNKTTRNSMQQAVQTDATSNIQRCCVRLHRALLKQKCRYSKAPRKRTQHCWMLHVASVCTPCCMLLLFVARSLKPVKLLATLKRTQQRNKETGKQTTYVAEQQQKTQLNNTMTMADPSYVINESPQMDVFYWQNNIRTKCTSEPKSKLVFFFLD